MKHASTFSQCRREYFQNIAVLSSVFVAVVMLLRVKHEEERLEAQWETAGIQEALEHLDHSLQRADARQREDLARIQDRIDRQHEQITCLRDGVEEAINSRKDERYGTHRLLSRRR